MPVLYTYNGTKVKTLKNAKNDRKAISFGKSIPFYKSYVKKIIALLCGNFQR